MDWTARKELSLIGLNFYERKENYERVITAMKSVARCEEALGNIKECSEYEEKLLKGNPLQKT